MECRKEKKKRKDRVVSNLLSRKDRRLDIQQGRGVQSCSIDTAEIMCDDRKEKEKKGGRKTDIQKDRKCVQRIRSGDKYLKGGHFFMI